MGQKWNEIPAGTLLTASQNLWGVLGANAGRVAEQLKRDQTFVRKAGAFLLSGGIKEPTSLELARYIMGRNRNWWGPTEWAEKYGARFNKKQIRDAGKFPWGEDILNSTCPLCGKVVKDCHFAFLGLTAINGFPLTVAKWLELHPATDQPKFYFNQNPWHAGQPHTDVTTMALRYYLLHTEIVPNSTGKTPEEQVAMLPPEYEVPTTITETTKDILVFHKTDVRPNGSKWAACTERTVKTSTARADLVSCVGHFDERGLSVYVWDGLRRSSVGVGASRKLF